MEACYRSINCIVSFLISVVIYCVDMAAEESEKRRLIQEMLDMPTAQFTEWAFEQAVMK